MTITVTSNDRGVQIRFADLPGEIRTGVGAFRPGVGIGSGKSHGDGGYTEAKPTPAHPEEPKEAFNGLGCA